jgi:hypothetical protein
MADLSIPVSNADSEHSFSMLRKIHTDQRANLDQSTIIALMSMKFNCNDCDRKLLSLPVKKLPLSSLLLLQQQGHLLPKYCSILLFMFTFHSLNCVNHKRIINGRGHACC